jgi:hypothetical protein
MKCNRDQPVDHDGAFSTFEEIGVPHSGHRLGLARRSYPQAKQFPSPGGRLNAARAKYQNAAAQSNAGNQSGTPMSRRPLPDTK